MMQFTLGLLIGCFVPPVGAVLLAAVIRLADRREEARRKRCIGIELQCGHRFPDGQRCIWHNGHPEHWEHHTMAYLGGGER